MAREKMRSCISRAKPTDKRCKKCGEKQAVTKKKCRQCGETSESLHSRALRAAFERGKTLRCSNSIEKLERAASQVHGGGPAVLLVVQTGSKVRVRKYGPKIRTSILDVLRADAMLCTPYESGSEKSILSASVPSPVDGTDGADVADRIATSTSSALSSQSAPPPSAPSSPSAPPPSAPSSPSAPSPSALSFPSAPPPSAPSSPSAPPPFAPSFPSAPSVPTVPSASSTEGTYEVRAITSHRWATDMGTPRKRLGVFFAQQISGKTRFIIM